MFEKRLRDYFIPNKENKYAPHGLQKAAMLGMVLLVVLSFTVTNVQSIVWMSSQWMVSTVLPAVIVDLTNQERDVESLGELHRNATLDTAAQLKANDMAKNSYFSHYSPDGVSPWYWFGQVSYNFVHAGENLAIHFTDSDKVVDAWMDSPAHRANIMNGNYTEIGIGTAPGTYEGYQTVYVVQLFGTPAATVASESVEIVETLAPIAVQPEEQPEEAVLSESVTITEAIAMIPAEPQPVVKEETIVEDEEVDNVESEPYILQNTVVSDMGVTNGGVIMYSDFISTSTGGVPATINPENVNTDKNTSHFFGIATQPHRILEAIYIIIGLFVLISLLISIFIEIHFQQPWQIFYGFGLLFLMAGLFYIQAVLTGGVLIA